ncbi:hypothetical protein [Parabacteroides gordonii]|uniref:hypothetical protein n=1 Tax=Parabacteroides gordonii TaxID=574930 RepID=UPI0026EFA99F|nr:hypothetical protein [Parabacteroides gordonii]
MGPNGAGKSTFGRLYTKGISIYDPDKRRMEIEKFFCSMTSEQLKQMYPMYTADMLDDLFEKLVDDYKSKEYAKCRDICIKNNLNFALETPFADNFGLDEVLLFKKKGYSINGILFGLNTVEESIANVALRVQKKGHDLLLESIRWNFKHSYLNVYNHINLFDQLHFVHAQSVAENPFLFASYSEGIINFSSSQPSVPLWFSLFAQYSYKT